MTPRPVATRSGTRLLAVLAVAGLTSLSACTSGDGVVAEPATAATDTEEEAGVDDAALEVVLRDFAFDGLPAAVAAGTRLTVVNEAERELHELVAFRLPDDEDRSVADLAGLSPPELMATLGEPTTVLLAEPGGPTIPAVGDGTLAEPGRYALMCFIPTGVEPAVYLDAAAESDEGPPDVGGGPPHIVHGMYAELTVE